MMTTDGLIAGAARHDITPDGPIWLDGYGNRTAPSEGVYLPIAARALFLAQAEEMALLLSAEVLGYDLAQARRIKRAISRATGVPERAIALAATHTHCGPRVAEMAMPGEIDPVYRARFEQALVDVARAAIATTAEVCVRRATTDWDLAINRRTRTPGGMVMRPNPHAPCDRRVTTLWLETPEGVPVASLTTYACHPTSRGGSLIGGDYPGAMMAALERDCGGVHLFALGCAGDIRPHFVGEDGGFRPATVEEVLARGEELAQRVRAARERATDSGPISLRAERAWAALPFATLPSREQLVAVARDDRSPLRRLWAERMLDLPALPAVAVAELQAIRLTRDVALICYAGEVVIDYAVWLKQQWPACVPIAYCNGSVGYVPSARIYPEGGYEVDGAYPYYLQPAPFAPAVEAILREATTLLLHRLGVSPATDGFDD